MKPLLGQTPSQTVGPYFATALTAVQYGYPFTSIAGPDMADTAVPGQRIRIEGQVLDGAGTAITDAVIEIWQADASGAYARLPVAPAAFSGFGRCGTGTAKAGLFWFETIKPGPAAPGQAPHVNVTVMMRGLLLHAFTRIYFADEAAANAQDPVLTAIAADRRHTLMAQKLLRDGAVIYRFDIRMQGPDETLFFDT